MKTDFPAMDRQRGLSLIELMVALLLSTLLILGITQVYIDNKRNYAFQQGQSDNLENARYALMLFEEELYRTGYQASADYGFENAFRADPNASENCAFSAGEVINFNVTDQRICIRYQPSLPQLTVCSGEAVPGLTDPYQADATPVTVELEISGNSLHCNGVPLINNMVDIKLMFGVSDDLSRETQKFTDVPAANERIRSVRYAALLKSRSENLTDDNNSRVYSAWREKWYSESGAVAPDRALYFSTENTIALRNLAK